MVLHYGEVCEHTDYETFKSLVLRCFNDDDPALYSDLKQADWGDGLLEKKDAYLILELMSRVDEIRRHPWKKSRAV